MHHVDTWVLTTIVLALVLAGLFLRLAWHDRDAINQWLRELARHRGKELGNYFSTEMKA